MSNSFFPLTWRGKTVKTTKQEKDLPLGQYDLIRLEKKVVEVIKNFIQEVFNYENINVQLNKIETSKKNPIGYSSAKLEPYNNHSKFHFASQLFNNQLYKFSITNIPVTTNSSHIHILFWVIMQFLNYFSENVISSKPMRDDKLIASSKFIQKSEIWLYNFEKTIIIEYLYALFNTYDENYSNDFKILPNLQRYNLDLIKTIVDFSYELSTKKIENKEIYCGFIFHDETSELRGNSVKAIKFKDQFNFGDFKQLKTYLEISNGQNIFFNVTNSKITHLIITKDKLNEIYLNPIGDGKTFQSRPLILSVQGVGQINFIEGRSDENKLILQIINSRPIIRDNNFIKQFLKKYLFEFSTSSDDRIIDIFSKWIMSLSQKKHGTSLILKNLTISQEKKLVKSIKITSPSFLVYNNLRYELSLLNNLVNPDGAIIFNTELTPTHISTILPISNSTGTHGGARHNSIANFTKQMNCLGIVISEDGPITIFKNGERQIKF